MLNDPDPAVPAPSPSPAPAHPIDVLGVRVDDVPIPALLDTIEAAITAGQRLLVVNANAHLVNLAQSRLWLRALFQRAEIAFCDGAGVQLACWALSGHKPHRHTPPQWIDELATRLGAAGRTVFWLGGQPQMVAQAAAALQARTGLRAVGWHHGFFDRTLHGAENEAVIAAINAARPDLLLMVMGMPIQEEWLDQNWHRIDARVAITAGALVEHAAGHARRPPLWVANLGLEWLVRLAIEPRRLWRRYLIGLPRFAWALAPHILHARLGRHPPPGPSAAASTRSTP